MAWITNDAGIADGNDYEGFHREWYIKKAGFATGPAADAYARHGIDEKLPTKDDLWERASARLDGLPYKLDDKFPRYKDGTMVTRYSPRFEDEGAPVEGEYSTALPIQFGLLVTQVVMHYASAPDAYAGFVTQFEIARSIHAGLADLPIAAQSSLRELLQSSYFGERDEPDEKVTASAGLSYI